jgi:hypothetical protein
MLAQEIWYSTAPVSVGTSAHATWCGQAVALAPTAAMAMVGSRKDEDARRSGGKRARRARRLRRKWQGGGGGDIGLEEKLGEEKRERKGLCRPWWREEGEWKGERGREGTEEV